jgi:hypothetical protein
MTELAEDFAQVVAEVGCHASLDDPESQAIRLLPR